MRRLLAGLVVASMLVCRPAFAWWDEGHMQIAYLAWTKLDPAVQAKADALLKLNADYAKWTAGAPDDDTARQWAFAHAATWPDDIKDRAGYTNDTDTVGPVAHQNIGYGDLNQHRYWHFKDALFSPDGTSFKPADPNEANAVTQLKVMIAALPESSGAAEGVRSYDLVWMLHLVGDLHQPLHAVSRITREIPDGDNGANAESVVPATGEPIVLHFYWDGIFGGYSSAFGAIFDAKESGLAKVAIDKAAAVNPDPAAWADESADLARQFGYAAPVGPGKTAVLLTRDYESNAHALAKGQAALAAARLANLLNSLLK